MRVWRVAKRAYWQPTGEGALLHPGRWHRRGHAVVYAAEHLSLAALEYLVHLEAEDVSTTLVAVALDVPDELVGTLDPASLPGDWRATPPPATLADLGTTWLASRRSVALLVPSVIVPVERNVLLNPEHPAFADVVVHDPEPFAFDARLLPA